MQDEVQVRVVMMLSADAWRRIEAIRHASMVARYLGEREASFTDVMRAVLDAGLASIEGASQVPR